MQTWDIRGKTLCLVQGDITKQTTDAIVTAANTGLLGGGGVDGAVHHAAGPRLLEACKTLSGCPTGQAVITPAFDLETCGTKHVIHAVGPIWQGGSQNEDALLASAYLKSMELAEQHALQSIAFPSISTGVYRFPLDRAAKIAVQEAITFLESFAKSLERVLFVLFNAPAKDSFVRALGAYCQSQNKTLSRDRVSF